MTHGCYLTLIIIGLYKYIHLEKFHSLTEITTGQTGTFGRFIDKTNNANCNLFQDLFDFIFKKMSADYFFKLNSLSTDTKVDCILILNF